MFQQQLPPFNNVVATGLATLSIPLYSLTLNKIVLSLGGTTFTKAMLTDIKLKVGSKTIFNAKGADLDKIQKYKGIFDAAGFLELDFTERDAPEIIGKEVGGIDLTRLGGRQLTLECQITGATAPTLSASAWYTAPQDNELTHKLIAIPGSSSVAGKVIVPILDQLKGSLIKRLHIMYNGTDWTAVANGNVNRVEVKKNGTLVHEMSCLEARFSQQTFRKVPQAKTFVVDFGVDNNVSSYLTTVDAKALEVALFLTAADGFTVYAEVVDLPDNA